MIAIEIEIEVEIVIVMTSAEIPQRRSEDILPAAMVRMAILLRRRRRLLLQRMVIITQRPTYHLPLTKTPIRMLILSRRPPNSNVSKNYVRKLWHPRSDERRKKTSDHLPHEQKQLHRKPILIIIIIIPLDVVLCITNN